MQISVFSPARQDPAEIQAMTFCRPLFHLSILSISLLIPHSSNAADGDRPNILFIIVDDQSPFDLKAYDPTSQLETPNIDRLAAEGMVIEDAYEMGAWVGAVCTSSRHMIMSGRTLWHIPDKAGRGNNPHQGNAELVPPNLEQQTLAAVFNRAGYDTMRTCKQGNSYEDANKQFTVRHDASKRGGTDETGSKWHGDQVMNYLTARDADKDTDPFMIYYGFSHPHDTRDGTPELLAKYGATNHTDRNSLPAANPKQPRLPINWLPAHPFHHGQPGLRVEVAVSGVWENRDPQTIRNEIGRHGLQGKQNLYEPTFRVPFIVRGPGIEAGSRATGNAYLLDSLATLCDMAGIDAPTTNEGSSLLPVLQGKKDSVRDTLYGAYCGGTKPGMRCVKKGDWKLIKYDVMDGTVRETQLFNLAENPNEFIAEHHDPAVIAQTGSEPSAIQTDLAEDPAYAEKLAEMEALLLEEMRRLDDPYRLWNQPDDGLPTPPAMIDRATRPDKDKAKTKGKQKKPKADPKQ